MKRLTERTKYGIVGNNNGVENFPLYSLYDETHLDHGLIEQCFNKLAEYEDLEEQGKLIILPCKVGDVVYQITRDFVSEFKIKTFIYDGESFFFYWQCIKGIYVNIIGFHSSSIGKDVFITKEEAKHALAKMKEV